MEWAAVLDLWMADTLFSFIDIKYSSVCSFSLNVEGIN